jgi:hypothetical protein
MVVSDPRRRATASTDVESSSPLPEEESEHPPVAPPSSSILFGGQDAMDEDEDLPPTSQSMSSMNANIGIANNNMSNINQQSKAGGGRWQQQLHSAELLSTIITPSPYPHHLTGPTSSRFRNALGRITNRPTSDVEAWQALISEVSTCYRSLPNKHGLDADTQNRLDWMESCYGTLLKYFPYSSTHYVTIVEMLLAQSARVGEEDGPIADYGFSLNTSPRVLLCQAKLERILERVLGFTMDGTHSSIQTISLPTVATKTTESPLNGDVTGADDSGEGDVDLDKQEDKSASSSPSVIAGMCNSSVELWLLYIRTKNRQATRQASTMGPIDGAQLVREWTLAAYELAVEHAGFAVNNHLLWKQYLTYVKSWTLISGGGGGNASGGGGGTTDHALAQKQMLQLRSIYQRLVAHPMTGLDQLWQDYEAFERAQSEALAQALLAEYSPKYQHARTVYLERNRVYSMIDLELDSRFATPPIDPHDEEEQANNTDTNEDVAAKMQEEQHFLTLWKKRIAYERTNPERLSAMALAQRVRQAFREMACVLTRHPEVWHMWSMWELHLGSGTGAAALETDAADGAEAKLKATSKESEKAYRAISVLALGLTHIPDCTLLAYTQAQITELHTAQPSACLQVMERFLETTSNTLGFVMYQQMVRRYKGIAPARAVFARARRVLLESKKFQKQRKKGKEGDTIGETTADNGAEGPETEVSGAGNEATSAVVEENGKRWMVTNRLDPSIGTSEAVPSWAGAVTPATGITSNGNRNTDGLEDQGAGDESQQPKSKPGPITWHLYASHATMEHRLNQSPEVAARVYELGLRKHVSFLTKPPYVMRYAQLLLELQDTVNLRALMTRAVTACEALAGGPATQDGTSKWQQQQQQGPNSSVAALWDMTLRFESLLSGAHPTNVSAMEAVEKRRRAALLGPDVEDVSTGGIVGLGGDAVGIGAHKSTIAEQLIRSDGYDVSSNIVNGMSRAVDVLEVMGLWGGGGGIGSSTSAMGAVAAAQRNTRLRMQQLLSPKTSSNDGTGQDDDEMPGGKSDACYQRRLLFQCLLAAGVSSDATMIDGGTGVAGSKILLSARERLQQGGAGMGAALAVAGGNPQAPNTAVTMAIQQSPEWMRPMLLLLPASRMRTIVLTKPPPHLTEMALTALRQNSLPVERPTDSEDGTRTLSGTKHRLESSGGGGGGGGGGDSSDEENGGMGGGGGFGTQFRARQRERQMMMASGHQNGLSDGSTKP